MFLKVILTTSLEADGRIATWLYKIEAVGDSVPD